jgi:hypothetical protein
MSELKFLAGYPASIQAQVQALISAGKLTDWAWIDAGYPARNFNSLIRLPLGSCLLLALNYRDLLV